MRKSILLMIITFLIASGMIMNAVILNHDIKIFLLVFFAVGMGLGLLRLFVNSMIKKMKGKGWSTKILFFSVLLGLGLPFQNWFRKEVIFSMESSYLLSSITIMIIGVIFITMFYKFISTRRASKNSAK